MTDSALARLLSNVPQTAKRVLLVEFSQHRFVAILLRTSSIWKWAIVGAPFNDAQWATQWQAQLAGQSPEDFQDWLRHGATPDGRSLATALEAKLSKWTVDQAEADFVLTVGDLCQMTLFREAVRKRCAGKLSDTSPTGMLPRDLDLRKEIARLNPPCVDADYAIQTAVLNQDKARLEMDALVLLKKGEPIPPPPGEAFAGKQLVRAGNSPSSVDLVLLKNGQACFPVKRITPANDCFYLQWWFDYRTDTLTWRAVADSQKASETVIPHREIQKADWDKSTLLPPLKPTRYLDVLFIVDGTMRQKDNNEWRPNIAAAKTFIADLLNEWQKDSGLDVQVALYLYGDWKHSGNADYPQRIWANQTPKSLARLITQGTDVVATEDRDYEALLESALHWANKKQSWRDKAQRAVVIIGYAPPHLPQSAPLYPADAGFTHEPFTSGFDWRIEAAELKKNATVMSIWVPYPDLDRNHRCMRWSAKVWSELADEDHCYTGLESPTGEQVRKAIVALLKPAYVAEGAIGLPLVAQNSALRF